MFENKADAISKIGFAIRGKNRQANAIDSDKIRFHSNKEKEI